MGRETILFKSEEKMTSAEAAAVIRTIAEKIEAGSITLTSHDSEIALDIPTRVTLEIKAEEEQGSNLKRSLEIEVEWMEGKAVDSKVTIT